MGLWPLACWDCGSEYGWGHGCLSFVSFVCCQVEFSVMGQSLVQRKPRSTGAVEPWKKVLILVKAYINNIRNLIILNYPCILTDDDFDRKLKHVSILSSNKQVLLINCPLIYFLLVQRYDALCRF
jgi:hypothetical protein